MKHLFALIVFFSIDFTCTAQSLDRDNEMRETISWINKQFSNHSTSKYYVLKEIVYVDNEPIMYLIKSPGTCSEEEDIQIPIKKIKPIRFEEIVSPLHEYHLYLETKNGEEIIWYQSDDKKCGQIGDHVFIYLEDSIEKNNLKNRLSEAFLYLMKLYGNDGKDKF